MSQPLVLSHSFSALYIVEFLGSLDDPTGTCLFNALKPKAAGVGVHLALYTPETREELFQVLRAILHECKTLGRGPILHLETHGSPAGISAVGDELVTWPELKPLLVSLNEVSRVNLLVTLAACHGLHLVQTLLPTDRSPLWGFIGPDDQVLPSDIRRGFLAFYSTFLTDLNLNAALDALRAADSSNPETWKVHFVETFFAYMYGEYIRLQATPEKLKQREDSIMATLFMQGRAPRGHAAKFRREIRRKLRHDESHFDRLKTNFLMLDLFPENGERFPITHDDALGLHRRVRALMPQRRSL